MNDFDRFAASYSSYEDFAQALGSEDNDPKGKVSEEYWRRWLHFFPHISNYLSIRNTNDRSAKSLLDKWPELSIAKVGSANSPTVDIIIEYEDGYDLVSCKWWRHGLTLDEIGTFFTFTNQHLPNLKNKYLLTTAPRASTVAREIAKAGKDVIILFEDESTFLVDEKTFAEIKNFKDGNAIPTPSKWRWRNYREAVSFRRMSKTIEKFGRAKFQGPPGWGKTQLMFRLDHRFWTRYGGITVNMADGTTVLKQNFEHFNLQYRAWGIQRPSLVICSGAEDHDMVDWPIEVVGKDPGKIARWIANNPDGMIFCFYGNTKSLEEAVAVIHESDPGFEFTLATCDEASRTCQKRGSGWSHIVHQDLVPVRYRAFFDATPRVGKNVGMDNKTLYGPLADAVTQAESEEWGSTVGYELVGMAINSRKISDYFHDRRLVIGKSYTVEDMAMAWMLLHEKIEDVNDQHTISFGFDIKRLNRLRQAVEDLRNDLINKYPKKYGSLKDLRLFVADTHHFTVSEIHRRLRNIYSNDKSSIVWTSRLLYRGWSQVKIDCVHFADNFKGTSYIVQALGRGLRTNSDKADKICKVLIPVDANQSEPWDHMVQLIDSLKQWDFRPAEAIMALVSKPRSVGKRRPQAGSVVLNMSGVKISLSALRKGLESLILLKYDHWILEKDYRLICDQIAIYWMEQDRQLKGYLELNTTPAKIRSKMRHIGSKIFKLYSKASVQGILDMIVTGRHPLLSDDVKAKVINYRVFQRPQLKSKELAEIEMIIRQHRVPQDFNKIIAKKYETSSPDQFTRKRFGSLIVSIYEDFIGQIGQMIIDSHDSSSRRNWASAALKLAKRHDLKHASLCWITKAIEGKYHQEIFNSNQQKKMHSLRKIIGPRGPLARISYQYRQQFFPDGRTAAAAVFPAIEIERAIKTIRAYANQGKHGWSVVSAC